MLKIRTCDDPAECRGIWEKTWPRQKLFDLWEVRNCFATSFKRRPVFLVAERRGTIEGLLALSRIDGRQASYTHFPGETWKGRTWLEQNRIPVHSSEVFAELLDAIPGPIHLRYLARESVPEDQWPVAVDEVGYLFYPRNYGFAFQSYMQEFSGKSRKKIARELKPLENMGVAYRYDHVADIQWLFRTNLESFGEDSYFYDPRFLDGMEKLAAWLHDRGMLRIVTLLLGGAIAAVDIGAVWEKSYTVLAGATNAFFPGVAKMINLHHLQWACGSRMEEVDFLCGDFGWKQRFHLSPRPLYELHVQPARQTMRQRCEYRVNIGE